MPESTVLLRAVLVPRYTTFVGARVFRTSPRSVADYATMFVNVWRGTLLGTGSPTFKVEVEESHDLVAWAVNGSSYVPLANSEV